MAQMCGGIGKVNVIDEEVKSICDQLRGELESKVGRTFTKYEPITYKSQVVAGTNFFVKIAIDDKEHIHVRIFRPLPHTGNPASVAAWKENMSLDAEIEYFDSQ